MGGPIQGPLFHLAAGTKSAVLIVWSRNMAVKRVVANIASADPAQAAAFYGDILGMDIVMDHGWIVTYGGQGTALAQLSVASEGGSGTPVPDFRSRWMIWTPCSNACDTRTSRLNMAQLKSHGVYVASTCATRSGAC